MKISILVKLHIGTWTVSFSLFYSQNQASEWFKILLCDLFNELANPIRLILVYFEINKTFDCVSNVNFTRLHTNFIFEGEVRKQILNILNHYQHMLDNKYVHDDIIIINSSPLNYEHNKLKRKRITNCLT